MQKIIASSLGRNRFPTTKDGERQIVWPQDATARDCAPYRGTGGRDHSDIPLPELAGLAAILRTTGLEEAEDIIRASASGDVLDAQVHFESLIQAKSEGNRVPCKDLKCLRFVFKSFSTNGWKMWYEAWYEMMIWVGNGENAYSEWRARNDSNVRPSDS